MTSSNVLSASGTIEKKEFVRNTRIKSVKDYLVLESVDPFPEAQMKHKSSFVKFYYLIISSDKLDQDIKIAAQSAEGHIDEDIASALGEIKVGDKTYYAIRLRNISTDNLSRLIKYYEYEGIKVHPANETVNDSAWIHVKKFFHLEEIEEGIYADLDDPQIGYVEAPNKMTWEELEDITEKVKKETAYSNFDRAIGTISKRGESREVIRIYAPEMNEEILKDISYAFRKHFKD
jgi:hypothetical protein